MTHPSTKCEHKNHIPAGHPFRCPLFGDGVIRVSSLYAVYCLDCGNYINLLTGENLNDKGLTTG